MGGPRADDLQFAQSAYVAKSPAFSAATRDRAAGFTKRSALTADAMTHEQFLLCVLQIAAFADNGHDTESDSGDAWWPTARLPVRMLWFEDQWVIARADSANADLLGARVLSIENHSPEEVFTRLRKYWGGLDTYRRWNLEPAIIEQAGMLHAAGLARHADRLTMRIQTAAGQRVERTLRYVAKSTLPPGQIFARLWSPAPWPGDPEKGWRAFRPPSTPLYLQDGAHLFRAEQIPQLNAMYVQMRAHFDIDGQSLGAFLRRVDAEIEAFHPRNLIVDLRFDTGGDTDLTREWQRTLPARIPSRLYVLVSRHTFSAGIVAVASFRHDAAARVRIVGERVGDRLRWWSEGEPVCMPNSHYCLHLTTGLWDLVYGCAGNPACYGDKYDARVADLAPDLEAPITADSWLAGRDPGMEAIERELRADQDASGASPAAD